jgi:glycosyltransferase involved in cell wall biosynthesis
MVEGILVSVVIPNFNRSGVVNETVRNVLSQSLPPFEVIIIDDGSTDDSVASLHLEFGDRIQLIEQPNQGPGAARNAGLKVATGEFVWLMDSDDLATLNKLEVQVAALRQNNADVVYGPWARVYFEGQTIRLDGRVLQQRALPANRDVLTWFMTDWSLVFQQCLFRNSILKQAGFYRTDMWTCDDSEYFVRILSNGAKVVFEDASLTLYRSNDHGKVTGSGFQSTRRMVDWAKCLIAMNDQCQARAEILNHARLQWRLWKSAMELRQACPEEATLIAELESRITRSSMRIWLEGMIDRIEKSARRRLTGISWAASFQTGELTSKQVQLIKSLGLQFAIS